MIRHPDEIQILPDDYCRRLDLARLFRSAAPLHVDVGCGDGGFLLELARRRGRDNFLGIERLFGRVRKICRQAVRDQLANLRVLRLECGYTVRYLLPPASVASMFVLFPDPWPKARHRPRRLLDAAFLSAARDSLRPDGELIIKTDHDDYARAIGHELAAVAGLRRLAWNDICVANIETDFERQFVAEGRPIHCFRACRADSAGRDCRGDRAGASQPPDAASHAG